MQAVYEDHMGTDIRVVNSARVSFSSKSWFIDGEYIPKKDSKHYQQWLQYRDWALESNALWDDKNGHKIISVQDFGLIQFLASHGHWTPFAHPQITLVMQAPVPIRTQCFKHKSGFVENEESRRYIKSTPKLFIPDEFRSAPDNAKQGSGGVHPDSDWIRDQYIQKAKESIREYERWIFMGAAPEQARFILPQGVEVEWYWTGSLAAFARFYKQRMDSHAQLEIRRLSFEVGKIIQPLYPVSWAALTQGVNNATSD